MRRISLLSLVLISLLSMAANPVPTAEFPRLLQVPSLHQLRYTSCGEAALTMAYNYANPETPMSEQEVIDFASRKGYYTGERWPFTSPANMLKIARHYALVLRTGSVHDQDQGLALLIDQLHEGEPVIIDVPVRLDDVGSVAHFILVTGISRDPGHGDAIMIHYNDPLTGDRLVSPWEGQAGIWNGWQNNEDPGGSGWWLAVPPP